MSDLDGYREALAADTDARLRRVKAVLEAHAGAVVEHTAESGVCRAEVDLEGNLVWVQFLVANVMRDRDRETLAEEVLGAIRGAQAKARTRFAALVDEAERA
ncbi:hypothetical protein [Glycomyces sp. NRRL B-16210]|uniref:hypothetical protein n=1 Tax=Glycomyces sp. NRRL B-16210 TaxID=1463821 RepID=UPI0004BF5083|nr:hypothetical protein [Glycomyces sp. NRRL B-16210]